MDAGSYRVLFVAWIKGAVCLQEWLFAVETFCEQLGWTWKPPGWARPYPWRETTKDEREEIERSFTVRCSTCDRPFLYYGGLPRPECGHCWHERELARRNAEFAGHAEHRDTTIVVDD